MPSSPLDVPADSPLPPVQGLWIGSELSHLERMSIGSFLAHGHPYHLYVYDDVGEVPAGTAVLDAAEVVPRESVYTLERAVSRGSYASFANLFRYVLLHERGGWWVDSDVVCLRPFDFDADHVFASERTLRGPPKICAGIVRAPAGSPLMRECMERALEISGSHLEFGENGFALFGPLVAEHGLEGFIQPPEVFNPLDFWKFRKVTRPSWKLALSPATRSVHLWNEMWRRAEAVGRAAGSVRPTPRTTLFGDDCEIGRLQRRYLDVPAKRG